MPNIHQSSHELTTRRAAYATVGGDCVVLDPLVSKYRAFHKGRPCEYEVKRVSAEAIHAMGCMPKVISRVESVLSNESGNQLHHIFNSKGDSRRRLFLTTAHTHTQGVVNARDIGLVAVRTNGSSCITKSAVAFHALVDIYSQMEHPPCKEVRRVYNNGHDWVEVLTHDDERVVFETWTLFPEALLAEDGFGYASENAWIRELWRPGADKREPWAEFTEAATSAGPIEQVPSSAQAWMDSLHMDEGLEGFAKATAKGSNIRSWNRAEACRTTSEREDIGLPGHRRVVYKGPDGSRYNGDLVPESRVNLHKRTRNAMHKAGFSAERFEARDILRRDLTLAVQKGDAAAVAALLTTHDKLIAIGPDCSGVLDDALWAAVRSHCGARVEIADALIKAGANELSTRDRGQTLLMEAAMVGDLEMVQALCEQGLRSDQRNEWGNNAFHLACNRGHVAMANYLQMKTPRLLHVPDAEGRSPLMLARLGGKPDIVEALLLAGAVPDN